MEEKNPSLVSHAVFGLLILAIIIFFFLFISDNPDFFNTVVSRYGLLGLFIAAIIANATIFLPVPMDVLVIFIGANPGLVGLQPGLMNYIIIALIVGLGAAIGEMTAYMIGLQGLAIAQKFGKEQVDKITQIKSNLGRGGTIVIFLGALVPFPFDFIGIAAGMMKFPAGKFFVVVFAGKTIKHFVAILAGALGIELLKKFLLF